MTIDDFAINNIGNLNENNNSCNSFYASLFSNNRSIMLLINPETGDIVDANSAACRFYGYSCTDIMKMKISQINTLSHEQVLEEMHKAKNENRLQFFFKHRLSDGEIRSVEVYSGPIVLNNRQLLYSIVHDVTDQRKAEEEIIDLNRTLEIKVIERTQQFQKANQQLEVMNASLEEEISERLKIEDALNKSMLEIRDLYENAPCGYHSLDQNGTIIRINDTELKWLGYSREEVLGNKFTEFITPDSKETYMKNFQEFLKRGWLKDLEFTIRHRDGTLRSVLLSGTAIKDEQGTFIMSRSTLYDISLKKLAEDKLKQLNHDLEEIIAYRTCHLEETNAVLEEEITHRQKAEDEIKNLNYQLVKTNAVLEETNAVLEEEIQEHYEVEAELVKAKEEAENANIAKSNFLAHMSHEIRTPMTGVMGILQLLQMSELNEEQFHYIQVCMTSSELLLKVINDILDYSKIEDGKLELEKVTFKVTELISNLEMLFSPAALNKSIDLEMHIEGDVPEILIGDPFKLRQVLSNLIGNALKFTHEGRIDLVMRKVADYDDQEIKLEFSVKDTGIGITHDKINELFKSFSQADSSTTRKYGGTGLGLAICKGLTKKMKGQIWVDSKANEGCTFYFTCVLEKPEGGGDCRKNESRDMENCGEEKPLKLLIVEDDEIIRMVIEKFSIRKGWKVVLAEDGYAALDAYQQQEFDVIIMDCQMPVLDGYKTTEAIRELESQSDTHTPIIAMTANALKGVKETCLNAGMDDYLTKPVETSEFYAIVERWAKTKQ